MSYQDRQDARRNRLETAAQQQEREADQRRKAADGIASFIPMGQPILVGHHSERRHRRDLDTIHTNMRKSIEADQQAEELERRAAAVGTAGIASDDPDALPQLRAKLEQLQARQERMKQVNKLVKKNDRPGIAAMGYNDREVEQFFRGDSQGRTGYPSFEITNNGTNIRRVEQRIAGLEKMTAAVDTFEDITGATFQMWLDDGRIVVKFGERQPQDIADAVRQHGFVYAPSRTAFVRKLTPNAIHEARRLAAFLKQREAATPTE